MSPRRSDADYAAMAADIETDNYTVHGPIVPGHTLMRGRPREGSETSGSSPVRSIRFPASLNERLAEYAAANHLSPSEVVREAVERYLPAQP